MDNLGTTSPEINQNETTKETILKTAFCFNLCYLCQLSFYGHNDQTRYKQQTLVFHHISKREALSPRGIQGSLIITLAYYANWSRTILVAPGVVDIVSVP
ncbi:hypothetical protein V6N11_065797 [Hibiscus sabdariffa]|uniref:Uncharacterized protein n=1 Tax=Hibiscus sabdariffa TaxID=183260 RepID=A0ABR2PIU8_9ROSI